MYNDVYIHVPTLMRMYKKRLRAYRAIVYTIQKEVKDFNQQQFKYEYNQSKDI